MFLVCTEVCWPYVGVMNPGSEAVDSECGGGSQDNYVGPLPAWFEGLTMVSLDEYPVSWLVAMRFWHRISLVKSLQSGPDILVSALEGLERTDKHIIIRIKGINDLRL